MDREMLTFVPPGRPNALSGEVVDASTGAGMFPADSGVGGLSEIMQLLGRHKGRLVVAASIGLVLGLLFASMLPRSYRARVALEIQNANADFLNARSVNSISENSAGDGGNLTDVATELKLMESDELLMRTIDALQKNGQLAPLQKAANPRFSVAHLLGRPAPTGEAATEALRETARSNVDVKQVGPTRAVEILFSSPDPRFAALFANTLAEQYVELSEETRWGNSRRTEQALERELERVRVRLQASQNALQQYATGSGLLFVNGQNTATAPVDISENKLAQLQQEVSQAQSERIAAQARSQTARLAPPDQLGTVLNDPLLRELEAKLTDLNRQLAELGSTYTDQNDKVQRVQVQILPLQKQFDARRHSLVESIRRDFNATSERERLLQTTYDAQVEVVRGKEGQALQHSILKEKVDSDQRLYDSVLEQVNRAGIAATVRSNHISIFDPARVPVLASSPRRLLVGVLGMVAAIILAILATLFTEPRDRRLVSVAEVRQLTRLRDLGAIPAASRSSVLSLALAKRNKVELTTWSNPRSLADEAFRAVLTSILFSGRQSGVPKTLLVTSSNPGEGKTTTACNISVLLAELGHRVLLVDADLRRPRLHTIFGVSGEHGYCDLLKSRSTGNKGAWIQQTFVPGLSVLPSGSCKENPITLLHSSPVRALLQSLRADYDTIVLDTPPCLSTADARIIGRSVDAVILVTRAGYTTAEALDTSAKLFALDRTPVLGTVLNDLKVPRSKYSYYAASA